MDPDPTGSVDRGGQSVDVPRGLAATPYGIKEGAK